MGDFVGEETIDALLEKYSLVYLSKNEMYYTYRIHSQDSVRQPFAQSNGFGVSCIGIEVEYPSWKGLRVLHSKLCFSLGTSPFLVLFRLFTGRDK